MTEIPNWASELMTEIATVKQMQADLSKPAPLPEPPAPKMIDMGFGDVPENQVPQWMLQQFAKEQAMLGAPTDIIGMLESERPDLYAGLRQHIREQQAAASNTTPEQTAQDEQSKAMARKALGSRLNPIGSDEFWR